MTKKFLKKNVSLVQLIPSILGLTTLSIFNLGEPVNAASLNCGPGKSWVKDCQSGVYNFSNVVTINVNFGFSPNNQPDFTAILSGKTSILIGNPIDAIVSDPLLGNVGSIDGNLDVIKTEFFKSISTGSTPFVPKITAIAGDKVPDLAPTPPESAPPYKSLYSAGAIVERADNTALADSFFNLFLEIQGTPEGTIRSRDPLTLTATSPLIGFPPGVDQNFVDYISAAITPLFTPGADGEFWTGDEVEVARLVPGANGRAVEVSLTAIPEPSTVFSSILIGLGMMVEYQRKQFTKRK